MRAPPLFSTLDSTCDGPRLGSTARPRTFSPYICHARGKRLQAFDLIGKWSRDTPTQAVCNLDVAFGTLAAQRKFRGDGRTEDRAQSDHEEFETRHERVDPWPIVILRATHPHRPAHTPERRSGLARTRSGSLKITTWISRHSLTTSRSACLPRDTPIIAYMLPALLNALTGQIMPTPGSGGLEHETRAAPVIGHSNAAWPQADAPQRLLVIPSLVQRA